MNKSSRFLLIFMIIVAIMLSGCEKGKEEKKDIYTTLDCWKDGYFHQHNVVFSESQDSIIRAKIAGKWSDFKLEKFPEEFMNWNVKRRLETLDIISKMIQGKISSSEGPELAGPHNGMVATYGFKRGDTQFKLNNAVKGMGFLPRKEKIKGIIEKLIETQENPMLDKLKVLKSFYNNADSIFTLDRQISLELYTNPKFETQTFVNQYTNPVSTIVFLDIPCFKLKTVVQLLHPDDPQLTDYQKDIVKYTNLVHSYFHGKFSKDFITVVYYVCEIYNNSPGTEKGMGHRIY